jgi:uncharacterized alpha-E superfamily protein
LRGLVKQTQAFDRGPVPAEDIPLAVSSLLRQITGFAGLVHENMYRSHGWRFLSIGASLERAANMCDVLAACLSEDAPTGALDLALEIGDSVVSHRARFQISADAGSVVDLLALDGNNPRSVHYHISRTKDHIENLPLQGAGQLMTLVARQILVLETRLATCEAPNVTSDYLIQVKHDIWTISDTLNEYHLA